MQGYKAFSSDLTCFGGFQYEIGKTYEIAESPKCCERGFHFCKNLSDCFYYYKFCSETRIAKVTALGDIDNGCDKLCTNKISIDKEIPWTEVLNIVNLGSYNSGMNNIGSYNTGDTNIGLYNLGTHNLGNGNIGNHNMGDVNCGYNNIGTGNKGNYNRGDYNAGDFNIGHYNPGTHNLGNYNKGNYNIGDYNIGTGCIGAFNTKNQTIKLFDQETNLTLADWYKSEAFFILRRKERLSYKEWWNSLSDVERNIILAIPNFDAVKFQIITGINIYDKENWLYGLI